MIGKLAKQVYQSASITVFECRGNVILRQESVSFYEDAHVPRRIKSRLESDDGDSGSSLWTAHFLNVFDGKIKGPCD